MRPHYRTKEASTHLDGKQDFCVQELEYCSGGEGIPNHSEIAFRVFRLNEVARRINL
jgi:hypothetical protein